MSQNLYVFRMVNGELIVAGLTDVKDKVFSVTQPHTIQQTKADENGGTQVMIQPSIPHEPHTPVDINRDLVMLHCMAPGLIEQGYRQALSRNVPEVEEVRIEDSFTQQKQN